MTDAKPAGFAKESTRPAYGGWAPGNYMCQCIGCRSIFIGDKRALHCADCAYGLPDTKAALDTERAARLAAEARVKVLEERLRELIGHLEIASVMPSATGKAYAPLLDADFLERARSELKEPANG